MSDTFQIIALLVLRDEADFIETSLSRFAKQFDKILVYDTGSLDSTWEIVLALAETHRNIVPLGQSHVRFSDNIRGYLWEHARGWLRPGDWFARVDADEVYHLEPRIFIADAWETERASQIFMQYYHFRPLPDELAAIGANPSAVDYEEQLRHYRICSSHGEPRFFRYRKHMFWEAGLNGPSDPGPIGTRKIPVRHYPARNLVQLQKRMALRRMMNQFRSTTPSAQMIEHWNEDWRAYLGDINDPELKVWPRGSEFEIVWRKDHVRKPRGIKERITSALHRNGLVEIKDVLKFRNTHLSDKIPRAMRMSEIQRIRETYNSIE